MLKITNVLSSAISLTSSYGDFLGSGFSATAAFYIGTDIYVTGNSGSSFGSTMFTNASRFLTKLDSSEYCSGTGVTPL